MIKKIIINSVDAIFGIAYISIAMPLIGWLLDSSTEWSTITFGEFFSDYGWWFNIWIVSLFYLPVRFLLRGKLWEIIFNKNSGIDN